MRNDLATASELLQSEQAQLALRQGSFDYGRLGIAWKGVMQHALEASGRCGLARMGHRGRHGIDARCHPMRTPLHG